MQLNKIKPNSSGSRHQVRISKNLLSKKNKIIKTLCKGVFFKSGRNSTGKITVRHKGGRIKNLFRKVNLDANFYKGIVISVFYDPIRSSFISLIFDLKRNFFFKVLSTNSVNPGSLISSDSKYSEFHLGCTTSLLNIPTGSVFHSLTEKKGKTYARSAGTYCQLLQKNSLNSKVRLPSGRVVNVLSESFGTLGIISNPLYNKRCLGKAGVNRLKGKRPSVRGIAMNPVDHPHGGRTNGGMPSVTPWGIPTKGKPTSKKNSYV